MVPTYSLLYFDGHGRAESIRLTFKHTGVEFEDTRIPSFAEWPAFKNDGMNNALIKYN